MNKEQKLVSTMAHGFVALGFKPPAFDRPKFYQFKLRRKLAYYRKNNWPFVINGGK